MRWRRKRRKGMAVAGQQADVGALRQAESPAQREYRQQEQLHRRNVRICRGMLLVLLLAVWELCARLGMIDDFIFSSPSRVFFCFWGMVRDGSIFGHIGDRKSTRLNSSH